MYYFAYGANMSAEGMIKRSAPFTFRKSAILKDYALAFNKQSRLKPENAVANIIPLTGSIVEGILYSIDETGLKNLDEYEGYPEEYLRKDIHVICEKESIKAIVYIAVANKIKDRLKPSKRYIAQLLEGKDLLSESHASFLKNIETAN